MSLGLNVFSDAALGKWGEVLCSYEVWLVVFITLVPIQFGGHCSAYDHFTKHPENSTARHHSHQGSVCPVTTLQNAQRTLKPATVHCELANL